MHHPHLSARTSLPIDNTIGIIFGALTIFISMLSVAIAWAMWRLKRQEDRPRLEETTSAQPAEQDLELQIIEAEHERSARDEENQESPEA
jgi:hypothetical protein